MRFIRYNAATGGILATGLCVAADLALQAGPGEAVIEGEADDLAHYVDLSGPSPVVVERPACPATLDKTSILANGTDEATISGIPVGSVAEVMDVAERTATVLPIDTAPYDLVITSAYPTTFHVTLKHSRHLDASFTVEAA